MFRGVEEKDNACCSDGTEGKVDVEAIQVDISVSKIPQAVHKFLAYHQRQLTLSVKAPPINGPMTDAIA